LDLSNYDQKIINFIDNNYFLKGKRKFENDSMKDNGNVKKHKLSEDINNGKYL